MANADSIKEAAGRKSAGSESAVGGALAEVRGWPARSKSFLGDVRAELKRVSWPTWAQVRATTGVVLVTVALFAAYLGILDYLFTQAVQALLNYGR